MSVKKCKRQKDRVNKTGCVHLQHKHSYLVRSKSKLESCHTDILESNNNKHLCFKQKLKLYK